MLYKNRQVDRIHIHVVMVLTLTHDDANHARGVTYAGSSEGTYEGYRDALHLAKKLCSVWRLAWFGTSSVTRLSTL